MEMTPEVGFDLVAAVTQAVRDRHATWRFVRDYARAWHRPLHPGDGLDASELADLQNRLTAAYPRIGALPRSLAESYALFGRARDLTSNQDRLLPHHQIHVDPTGQTLVLRIENQGCAQWGIRLDDLDQDDPPTVMHLPHEPGRWRPYAPRWSLACLELVLFESLLRGPDDDPAALWDIASDESTVAAIRQRYRRLPVPDLPHWALPTVHWYAGPDLLIRDEAQTWLWARGRTPQALIPLHHLLEPVAGCARRGIIRA